MTYKILYTKMNNLTIFLGVIQLVNKIERFGSSFSQSDEQLLEAFAIFCGLGISNTRIYEETARLAAKQQVILEVENLLSLCITPSTL